MARSQWARLTRGDRVALAALLAVSLVYHAAFRGHRRPLFSLSRDAANIASFAAASDHPELFKNDALLGNPRNTKF